MLYEAMILCMLYFLSQDSRIVGIGQWIMGGVDSSSLGFHWQDCRYLKLPIFGQVQFNTNGFPYLLISGKYI